MDQLLHHYCFIITTHNGTLLPLLPIISISLLLITTLTTYYFHIKQSITASLCSNTPELYFVCPLLIITQLFYSSTNGMITASLLLYYYMQWSITTITTHYFHFITSHYVFSLRGVFMNFQQFKTLKITTCSAAEMRLGFSYDCRGIK
jgi:hypothetical protein